EVCETTGADVTALSKAIGYDDRIGHKFLRAGLGFGGGCLPKDIRAFIARAGELGVDQAVSFLREVDEINLRRRARTVELGLDLIDGSYRGTRIAILGAAFKPNSDDIRDSPALDVAASIGRRGGDVVVYDPQALDNARRAHPELAYVNSLHEALAGADVTMVLTEWDEFQDMDPVAVGEQVAQRNMVDGRNILDPVAWRKAGWRYRALGRP
ncbi:MAG TPA: UDP binding domain-containing protein, partial [Jatrophihabitantaceae bacterium]|nr:UDP binding domain-containing protein [Jatrophihabitantaceae bacterium]